MMKWPSFIVKYKLQHILIWLLIFAGWYFFRSDDFPSTRIALLITFIKVVFIAGLVYITTGWLIPRFLYRKKYAAFFTFYFMLVFVAGLIKLSIIIEIIYPGLNPFLRFKNRIYDNIIPVFLLVSTGAAVKLIRDYLDSQKRIIEIAREKAETELNYLKSQINPHFLFNSINSIYFLIDKENNQARNALLQFSDLLRYQLYECGNEKIEVEKELSYLNDYIRLQKLRKDYNYRISVEHNDNVTGFKIVPLLLMPLVENAFKHISHHADGNNFVDIGFSRSNGHFRFHVENSREIIQSNDPSGGIGLKNVQRRLDLLYPGKHEIQIHQSERSFRVDLALAIN